MRQYMNRGSKRRISVIFQLLQGRPLRQQDIGRKINKDSFLEENEKVDEGKLSHVLKSLAADDIIERQPVMLEGKGAPQMAAWLIRTPETLVKILKQFNNPELEKAGYFQRHLIKSSYVQSMINNELIKFIELNIINLIKEKLNVIDFQLFNDKEIELLLKILSTSPSALYYATENYDMAIKSLIKSREKQLKLVDDSLKDDLNNRMINIIKKNFYLNLQLKLGEDLNKNIVKFGSPIQFKVSLKFLDDTKKDQFWKLHCENNEIETIFLRNNY